MTLLNAINLFESLKTESSKKSEIKVYTQFIEILKKLENREFTIDEIQSIETELERLNLKSNPEKRKKFFSKALSKFEKYLKETFSLTSKGYYTQLGVGLGSSFGILFGIVILSSFERSLGIAMGISIGMIIGLIMGRSFDSQAKTAGTIL